MALIRKLVNTHRRRTGSPLPVPRWIIAHSEVIPFTMEGEDPDITWEYILDQTLKGRRADRIGDCIYLTGKASGFEGRAQ